MKRFVSVVSVSLLTSLGAFSSGCATDVDDATTRDDALGSSADRKDLAKLLASGKISSDTLGDYVSANGVKIVHDLGGVSAVAEAAEDAAEGDEPALDRLHAALAGGIDGTVKDATSFPAYSCERQAYGATSDFDGQAVYLMGIDSLTFDLLTRTSVEAAEAAGRRADREIQIRLSEAQQKVTFAAFLPAKQAVLFFGRERVTDAEGKAKKVWRIYAADLTSPKCDAPRASLPRGTINGKTFAATGGAAYIDIENGLNITFSNASNTCDIYEHARFDAGATYVLMSGLKAKVGSSRPVGTSALTVSEGCSWGMYMSAGMSYRSRGVLDDTRVKITRLDSVVEGTVSMKFDDGSVFKGDFSVPICTGFAYGGEERCQ